MGKSFHSLPDLGVVVSCHCGLVTAMTLRPEAGSAYRQGGARIRLPLDELMDELLDVLTVVLGNGGHLPAVPHTSSLRAGVQRLLRWWAGRRAGIGGGDSARASRLLTS